MTFARRNTRPIPSEGVRALSERAAMACQCPTNYRPTEARALRARRNGLPM